jgi:hypothetical protein
MSKTRFRVLVVKYKDVPKNLYTQVFDSNDEAVKDAQERLRQLEGDAAIVTKLEGTTQEVVQRFEWAKAGTAKAKAEAQ